MQGSIVRTLAWSLTILAMLGVSALLATPREAGACGGTPPPPRPFCNKGYSFAKNVPAVVFCTPPTAFVPINTFHFLSLTEANPQMPVCPPGPHTVTMSVTLLCAPPPSTGPVVFGPFPIVANAPTFIPIVLATPCVTRTCVLSIVSTVTLSDGTTLTQRGDVEVCIVEEDPSQSPPGVPRLDLENLALDGLTNIHPGDQGGVPYRLTNNDLDESVTVIIRADTNNTSRQPGEASGSPVREAYAFADPGDGDDWPVRISTNLPPGECIPLPPDPQNQTLSEDFSDPITLGPGESFDFEVIARPWGMCADGSCVESNVKAEGLFEFGDPALACASALYWADATKEPDYLWADSGKTVDVFVDELGPFIELPGQPRPDPTDLVLVGFPPPLPLNINVNGLPLPAEVFPESELLRPFYGRHTMNIFPFNPGDFQVDSFFDIEYRIDFQGGPGPGGQFQTELLSMDLIGGAPVGFENLAPLGMGELRVLRDLGGGDFQVDSFFDITYQISGYGQDDFGQWLPLQIFSAQTSPIPGTSSAIVQLSGSFGGVPVAPADAGLGPAPAAGDLPSTSAGPIRPATDRGVAPGAIIGVQIFTDVRAFARSAPVPGCVGDINGDGFTDVFDFGDLTAAFGSMPGDPNWNPNADIVPDGQIDVFDFAELTADFGCTP
jgi:hypothetical protein